jgi:uncharacterized membrane protein YeaQ/YmgE (transglycosylase-associated protein family)
MPIGGLISALVVGLIIGALGHLVVPGKQNMGILVTMAVGVVAALLGTAIAAVPASPTPTGWTGSKSFSRLPWSPSASSSSPSS